MSETDRRRAMSGRSNAKQSGASVASQKILDNKPRNLGCEVHLIPQVWEGDKLYTLSGSGERCQCKSNVDDWVIAIRGWPEGQDVRLCPKHMAELARSTYVTVETIESVATRLALEEEAAAAQSQLSDGAPRASPNGSARSTASSSSATFSAMAAADTVESRDDLGYPMVGVDRSGRPYGLRAQAQLRGDTSPEAQVDGWCGRLATLTCSAQLCRDQLGIPVKGAHDIKWLAKCTGRSSDSTPDVPMVELLVVNLNRVVSLSADSVGDRTSQLQVQWIPDSDVAQAGKVCPWDGCDAVGTPWEQLEEGQLSGGLAPLEAEMEYQQRGMPAVGVPLGTGLNPGQGITGKPVPRSPGSAVQRWSRRVESQSPASIGSADYARGVAVEASEKREKQRDEEAMLKAKAAVHCRSVDSPGSSNSNSSGEYMGSSSSSGSSSGSPEVGGGRIEARITREKSAAARNSAAAKVSRGPGPDFDDRDVSAGGVSAGFGGRTVDKLGGAPGKFSDLPARKIVPAPSPLDFGSGGVGSGASGGPEPVAPDITQTHTRGPAGRSGEFSGAEEKSQEKMTAVGNTTVAAQAAAARGSPGWEDSSVLEGSLKTHQAAPDAEVCVR